MAALVSWRYSALSAALYRFGYGANEIDQLDKYDAAISRATATTGWYGAPHSYASEVGNVRAHADVARMLAENFGVRINVSGENERSYVTTSRLTVDCASTQ